MNTNNFVGLLLIAAGFSGWPTLCSFSKVNGSLVGIVVGFSTAFTVLAVSSRKVIQIGGINSTAWAVLILGGIINGLAFYGYSNKIAAREIPVSVLVPMVAIMVTLLGPLFEWLLKGTVPNIKLSAGLVSAVIIIYFSSK